MTDAQILYKIAHELALIRNLMAEFVALVRDASPEPDKDTKPRTGQPDNAVSHPRNE